jgi:trans-L-3-hydroxyproline dehydratase
MGVLFLTNEGYSTMCGHATIALGRLLVDYAGSSAENLFDPDPLRKLERDPKKREMYVRLHAPCGLVRVTVPIVAEEKGGWRTDLTRHISYNSVPSFATGVSLSVQFTPPPPSSLYTPGGEQRSLTFDIAYGGAFYIIARAEDLGLDSKILTIAERKHLDMLDKLTLNMRKAFARTLEKKYLKHPKEPRLEELYGVIVTGSSNPAAGRKDDLAICFFADQQVDRSPTGSGVQARIALAHAKGEIGLNELRFFHSPVSAAFEDGAFTGEAVQEVDIGKGRKGVIVKVSGSARYTGSSTFVVEDDDEIGKGFFFEQVGSRARE